MPMAYRPTTFRERLLNVLGCTDCSCIGGVHYDAADLQTLRELEEPERHSVGINGAYRQYQRRSRLSLRLASWREDVKKCGQDDELHHKLAQIQAAQYRAPSRAASVPAMSSSAAATSSRRTASMASVPVSGRSVSAAHSSDDESVYTIVPGSPHDCEAGGRMSRRRTVLVDEEEDEEKQPEHASRSQQA